MTEKFELASLDIETMGTGPSAALITISAVAFHPDTLLHQPDMEDRQFFTAKIDIEDAAKHGKLDAGTIKWWMQQSDTARMEAISGAESLLTALVRFSDWVTDTLTDDYMIGCNDVDFDKVITHSAYAAVGYPRMSPFDFARGRHWLSLPTMEWLVRNVLGVELQYHAPVVPHDSLYDALAQARRMQQVIEVLRHVRGALGASDIYAADDKLFERFGAMAFESTRDKTNMTLGEADEEDTSMEEADTGRESCEEESHQSDVGEP